MLKTTKAATKATFTFLLAGGPEQIRTAVEAFAELCLTTRPQDPFFERANIGDFYFIKSN